MKSEGRSALLLAWSLGLSLSCGTMGDPGPPGPMGAEGQQGPPGPAVIDCPDGYVKSAEGSFTVCTSGNDVLVRVGTGRTAFWIDRYEASVFSDAAGAMTQYGQTNDTYPGFPKNGQYATPLYAVSKTGVKPSSSITWFQAQAACRTSGKRLPTRDEWLEAARGTPDPGTNSGSQGLCLTIATGPRQTGQATSCRSRWGAEDMIGNLMEWTDEWYAGLGDGTSNVQPWPQASADYGNDGTWNITSKAAADTGVPVTGLPAAGLRGGDWVFAAQDGVFALYLGSAPSEWSLRIGFRCVVPR